VAPKPAQILQSGCVGSVRQVAQIAFDIFEYSGVFVPRNGYAQINIEMALSSGAFRAGGRATSLNVAALWQESRIE